MNIPPNFHEFLLNIYIYNNVGDVKKNKIPMKYSEN